MALVMISKLCVIYPYALNKVAAYLKDRGGGNWYRFNKEAMKMGLGRMLSGMVLAERVQTSELNRRRARPLCIDVGRMEHAI